jgi:hypothetical protein
MRDKIIKLGMHSFPRCFRLGMVMTRLCPQKTGNCCDLVHNTCKCEDPIYIDHLLLLWLIVSDINFFPPTSEEIRNVDEVHADPLLQQCPSKAKQPTLLHAMTLFIKNC